MENQNWTVYIIQATTGKLYTGITTDLERRLKMHQNKKGARFFISQAQKKFCTPNRNRIALRLLKEKPLLKS